MQAVLGHSGFDVAIDRGNVHLPDWTNVYTFSDLLEPEAVDEALLTIPRCGYTPHIDNTKSGLHFSTHGLLDEAMAESVQKIRPILHEFVVPSIVRVELFSSEEARNSTEDGRRVRIHNVTDTILSMLAQTNN